MAGTRSPLDQKPDVNINTPILEPQQNYHSSLMKTPMYAKGNSRTCYMISGNEYSFNNYTQLRFISYQNGTAAEILADTCAAPSLISRSFLQRHWPSAVERQAKHPFPVGSVGTGGLLVTTFATVMVTCRTTKDNAVSFPVEFCVVDELSCKALIGVSVLRKNRLHIQWGRENENDHLVTDKGERIPATCLNGRRPGKDIRRVFAVRAAEDYYISPNSGFNMKVRAGNKRKTVPVRADGYHLAAKPSTDQTGLAYTSLMNSIVTGQEARLPLVNLGDAPLFVRKGTLLGHLHPVRITEDPKVFCTNATVKSTNGNSAGTHRNSAILLADLLGDTPVVQEPEDLKIPDGYPYHLPNMEPPPQVRQADISDHWGKSAKEDIVNVITKHIGLFREGIGRFNDGVEMPIDFHKDANISDLV